MFKDWLYIGIKLKENSFITDKLICPECGNNGIDYMYVGDNETNIGYLPIWCNKCNHGIQISRVEIPEGAKRLGFEDIERIREIIPNFIQIYPGKNKL